MIRSSFHAAVLLAVLLLVPSTGCDTVRQVASQAGLPTTAQPSTDEVAAGLKEALTVGVGNGTQRLGSVDGYLKNELVRILLPPEAREVQDFIQRNGGSLGRRLLDDLATKMNRAAEQAAADPRTRQIFVDAIRGITIQDAWNILRGDSTAATRYLQGRTQTQLTNLFSPVIAQEMDRVGLQNTWTDLASLYNRIAALTPGRKRLPTDISAYVTTQALEGVFKTVGQEEARIRQNPAARVTELLRKVFAYQ